MFIKLLTKKERLNDLTSLALKCMKASKISTPCSTYVTVSNAAFITLIIITSISLTAERNL